MISMACMDGLIARTALMPCSNYNNSWPTTRLLALRDFHTTIFVLFVTLVLRLSTTQETRLQQETCREALFSVNRSRDRGSSRSEDRSIVGPRDRGIVKPTSFYESRIFISFQEVRTWSLTGDSTAL